MSAAVIPAIVAARIRRYKEAFRLAGATAPERAIRLADTGLRESLIFQKLVREQILVSAGNGRYYLDERRAAAVSSTKRKILVAVVLVVLLLAIIATIATR